MTWIFPIFISNLRDRYYIHVFRAVQIFVTGGFSWTANADANSSLLHWFDLSPINHLELSLPSILLKGIAARNSQFTSTLFELVMSVWGNNREESPFRAFCHVLPSRRAGWIGWKLWLSVPQGRWKGRQIWLSRWRGSSVEWVLHTENGCHPNRKTWALSRSLVTFPVVDWKWLWHASQNTELNLN